MMPFDENTYGKISLVAPIEYHPSAPSASGCVSKSLAGSYSYSRTTSSRRIGDQTYRIFGRDPRVYAAYNLASSNTWIDIAEFSTKWTPDHATHAASRAYLHVHGLSGVCVANLRVVAVGGATDTGSAYQLSIDTSNADTTADANFGFEGRGTTPAIIEAEVELATVTKDAQVTFTVQGFVSDDGGSGARPFSVAYIVAWWECRA